MQSVKAIPGELRQSLMVADIVKKKIREVARKAYAERRKIRLLKDVKSGSDSKEVEGGRCMRGNYELLCIDNLILMNEVMVGLDFVYLSYSCSTDLLS